MENMEKYLTIRQVAELLSLTPLTVWKKVKDGTFEAYQIKGSREWRITETIFFNFERTYKKYGKKKTDPVKPV